jgi:hypothetical protein
MAAKKFLRLVAGKITEIAGIQTSAGAGNAGDVAVLDDTGKFDITMMPVGVGFDTMTITASEALSDGDFVNVWNSAGSARVRKADASTSGKEASGFVLAAVSNGNPALVFFIGTENTHITGATPGLVYLSDTTPGGFKTTVPTTSTGIVQPIGYAGSATEILFIPQLPVVLA